MIERGDELLTSALTLGEVLVKPSEVDRRDLAESYETAINRGARVISFDREAARHYARIRSDRSIRPPDAMQLACAARGNCDLFVTNDERLSRVVVEGIQFITGLSRAPL